MAGFFKKALGVFVEVDATEPELEPVSAEDLDEEARALLAEIEAGAARESSPAPPPAAPSPVPTDGPAVATGAPLEQIYRSAGVPESPYSAEMLLRVAEVLRSLPLPQARAAVEAMDAADDRWTVGDVLLDAERKIEALRGVEADMHARRQQAEARHQQSESSIADQLEATEAEINAQIAELQALLQQADQEAAVARAQALSELEATQKACSAEITRLQGEVARLAQVYTFLGEPPQG